jgi:hypothetical protein
MLEEPIMITLHRIVVATTVSVCSELFFYKHAEVDTSKMHILICRIGMLTCSETGSLMMDTTKLIIYMHSVLDVSVVGPLTYFNHMHG